VSLYNIGSAFLHFPSLRSAPDFSTPAFSVAPLGLWYSVRGGCLRRTALDRNRLITWPHIGRCQCAAAVNAASKVRNAMGHRTGGSRRRPVWFITTCRRCLHCSTGALLSVDSHRRCRDHRHTLLFLGVTRKAYQR